MNQLIKVFENKNLTIIENEGEPKFLLRDICNILELGQDTHIKICLDDEVISEHFIRDSLGRTHQATFINEDGLYDVIFNSRKKEAKKFRKWIISEVLPSIRKTGSHQKLQTHLESIQEAINQLVEQDKHINQLQGQVHNISNIDTMTDIEWREKVNIILRKIAQKWSGVEPYQSVTNLSYERFEKRAGCKLDILLNNHKEKALAQGMTKSYIQKINKLDCIAEEKHLLEIYLQVIKKMAIEFKINIHDLNFEEMI